MIIVLLLLFAAAWTDELILQPAVAEQIPTVRDHTEMAIPITHEGCSDRCGPTSIPFPFGMHNEPGCFRPGFQVFCNSSFDPPRAFLAFDSVGAHDYYQILQGVSGHLPSLDTAPELPLELVDIAVGEGEARASGAVSSYCAINSTDQFLTSQITALDEYGPFVLSAARNVLVGVGGTVLPVLVNSLLPYPGKQDFLPSCLSDLMGNLQYAANGSCATRGCCQAELPDKNPFTYFAIIFNGLLWNSSLYNDSPCSYGMVVQRLFYNFSTLDLYGKEVLPKRYPRGVPFVLNFAIRNNGGVNSSSCPRHGQQPPYDYACVSRDSICVDAKEGQSGYFCKCKPKYQGNPYIPNGCRDIDECKGTKYPCDAHSICENTPGGFNCVCKSGMKRDATGTCQEMVRRIYIAILLVPALIIVPILMLMGNQVWKQKKFYEQNGGPLLKDAKNIRIYTKRQVKKITSDYHDIIGAGGFGKVYMGTLEDKQKVAIKKAIKVDKERKKEFIDEVIIQSHMRHKNITRLLGCCLELDDPLLVYEFLARGSLHDNLFKHNLFNIPVKARLRIAIGSAEGLSYMHSSGERTIRYGDVKSGNILLDENMFPKVSDFGTSSPLAGGKANKAAWVTGDKSYIDPVYMDEGIITQKNDVYNFGVVLIELITRRPAAYDDKRSYVSNFVQACLDKRIRGFIDNDVTSEEDIELLEKLSAVAVECLKLDLEERPDMRHVEQGLQSIEIHAYGDHKMNYGESLSPTRDDVALLKAPTN